MCVFYSSQDFGNVEKSLSKTGMRLTETSWCTSCPIWAYYCAPNVILVKSFSLCCTGFTYMHHTANLQNIGLLPRYHKNVVCVLFYVGDRPACKE
jgi:hypothetical protein